MSQLFKYHSSHVPFSLAVHHNMAAKHNWCLFYCQLSGASFKSSMDVQKCLFVVSKQWSQRIPMTLCKLNYHWWNSVSKTIMSYSHQRKLKWGNVWNNPLWRCLSILNSNSSEKLGNVSYEAFAWISLDKCQLVCSHTHMQTIMSLRDTQ